MLKNTRFNLYAYRWAIPGMVGMVAVIGLLNSLSSYRGRNISVVLLGSTVAYMLLINFLLMNLAVPGMVQFAMNFGCTRRRFCLELPVVTAVFTLLFNICFFAVGQLQCRLLAGAWLPLSGRGWALLLAASWALGALGTLIALLGVRFGWKGWVGGYVGLLAAGLGIIPVALLPGFAAMRDGVAGLLFSESPWAVPGAFCLAAALCAVFHGLGLVLLRRYCVK